MIERLRHALEHVEDLPAVEQERLAERIEERIQRYHRERSGGNQANEPQPNSPASRIAGVWRDLPDDMEETLEAWRKASVPTPPVTDQLRELGSQGDGSAEDEW